MSDTDTAAPQKKNEAAFAPVSGGARNAAPVMAYAEQPAAFASGLPAWNIEPPEVVVRRKARI